jgi:hypothetical protein
MNNTTENRRTSALTNVRINDGQIFKLQVVTYNRAGVIHIIDEFTSSGPEDFNRLLTFVNRLADLYDAQVLLYLRKCNM